MLDNQGFTLLELLIAMMMMAIIAASLYTSMSIGFRARESAEKVVEKGRSVEIAVELIKGMLASAMDPDGVLAGEFKGEDESGDSGYDADILTFYTADHNPGEDELASDIEKVELSVSTREDTEEKVIVRKVTTNLLSPETLDPDEEILCPNVRSMNLEYYDGSDWQDEWDSSENDNALPKAVKITIVLEKDESSDKNDNNDDDEDHYEYTEIIMLPCS
jgi:type II secretion system protein J